MYYFKIMIYLCRHLIYFASICDFCLIYEAFGITGCLFGHIIFYNNRMIIEFCIFSFCCFIVIFSFRFLFFLFIERMQPLHSCWILLNCRFSGFSSGHRSWYLILMSMLVHFLLVCFCAGYCGIANWKWILLYTITIIFHICIKYGFRYILYWLPVATLKQQSTKTIHVYSIKHIIWNTRCSYSHNIRVLKPTNVVL